MDQGTDDSFLVVFESREGPLLLIFLKIVGQVQRPRGFHRKGIKETFETAYYVM